ncbi:MAG: UPF0147 family protein [Thermoplasmata archaeon]
MDKQQKLKEVIEYISQLAEDNTIPRNIRRGASTVKERLMKENESLDVRLASAIFQLDELANEPNIPMHGRTMIWNIISHLEALQKGE